MFPLVQFQGLKHEEFMMSDTYTCSSGIACSGNTVHNYGDVCSSCLAEGKRRQLAAKEAKKANKQ
jgi:hypothetical protein